MESESVQDEQILATPIDLRTHSPKLMMAAESRKPMAVILLFVLS
ncbi:unnamed protein product [Gongylonema pulchrum]|uniref:Uncharacterized protein n=1 Tax=Gongylonema pulchrum TaxID=637853 RepID=A0A3P7PH93_9BILA|nr:unnamed protein product [Gongylonema pulchrum]